MKKKKKLNKNTRTIILLAAFVVCMIGIAYASVPLYTIFCRATGFGGTTQRVAFDRPPASSEDTGTALPRPVKNQTITVSFDGNVDQSLPWDFSPGVRKVQIKLGEAVTVIYHAHNRGVVPLVGMATFNVQPDKAGAYFDKIQCFCFTNQTLQPGETADLPVRFYIDPAMADDVNTRDITNITLSYTFFLAKDQSEATAKKEAPVPSDEPSSP